MPTRSPSRTGTGSVMRRPPTQTPLTLRQVAQPQALRQALDEGVVARHHRVRQHDVAIGRPADDDALLAQKKGLDGG